MLVIVQVRQHKLSSKIVVQITRNRVQIWRHEIVIVARGICFLNSRKRAGQFQTGSHHPSRVLNHTLVRQCPLQSIDFDVGGYLPTKHVGHLIIGARGKQHLLIGHVLGQILQLFSHLDEIWESPHQAVLLKEDITAVIMGLRLLQVFGRGVLGLAPASHYGKQKRQNHYMMKWFHGGKGKNSFHFCYLNGFNSLSPALLLFLRWQSLHSLSARRRPPQCLSYS